RHKEEARPLGEGGGGGGGGGPIVRATFRPPWGAGAAGGSARLFQAPRAYRRSDPGVRLGQRSSIVGDRQILLGGGPARIRRVWSHRDVAGVERQSAGSGTARDGWTADSRHRDPY